MTSFILVSITKLLQGKGERKKAVRDYPRQAFRTCQKRKMHNRLCLGDQDNVFFVKKASSIFAASANQSERAPARLQDPHSGCYPRWARVHPRPCRVAIHWFCWSFSTVGMSARGFARPIRGPLSRPML